MLETIKDDKGNLKAVCVYMIINKEQRVDPKGDKIIIEEMEINPEYRGNGVARQFIKNLLTKYPALETCHFIREYKYPNRGVRTYTRKQFELLTKE